MKRIGYIDGRRVRYVADGVTKFAIRSWGVVMGGVAGSMSLYLAADYGAYIMSSAAGHLDLCASTHLVMRVGGNPFLTIVVAGISSNKLVTLTQGLYIGDTAYLRLPHIDGGTEPEGSIWYVPQTDSLQFMTAGGVKKTIATT